MHGNGDDLQYQYLRSTGDAVLVMHRLVDNMFQIATKKKLTGGGLSLCPWSVSVISIAMCWHNASYAQQPVRQFRAAGSHQCQSNTDIGHQCTVFGTGYTDCDQAYYSLKRDDCCPRTRKMMGGKDRLGGDSISFKLTSCTQF
jgi:hypothetical protein